MRTARPSFSVRRLFIDPLSPAELAMLAQISNRILEELEKDCG
ncbi:hypothetical protein [Streptomyces botrytidirepellens]|nr:hypothetical protein [Streptomyces botrytidirepellens]